MNIKKTIITLFVSSLLVAGSSIAYAEEAAAPVVAEKSGAAETVVHLEKALENATKSDFSTATLNLKAARNSAAEVAGQALEVHKGVSDINNGMKAVRAGQSEKAVAEIQKAIAAFKAL